MQIPCGVHSEVPEENVVREVAPASWRGIPAVGATEGVPDTRGAPDVGSCSHADCDTAEVRGIAGGWLPQGEKCDPRSSSIW